MNKFCLNIVDRYYLQLPDTEIADAEIVRLKPLVEIIEYDTEVGQPEECLLW